MKTVAVSKRSQELKHILGLAQKEDLVIRTADGDEFLISQIDGFSREIAQQRQNQKLMAFLDERFRQTRQGKCVPLAEVERQLGSKRGQSDGNKIPRSKARSHKR